MEYQDQKCICGRDRRWWRRAYGDRRGTGGCGTDGHEKRTYRISRIIHQWKSNVKVICSYINSDSTFSLILCLPHRIIYLWKYWLNIVYQKYCVWNWIAALKLIRFVITVTVILFFIIISDFIVTGKPLLNALMMSQQCFLMLLVSYRSVYCD